MDMAAPEGSGRWCAHGRNGRRPWEPVLTGGQGQEPAGQDGQRGQCSARGRLDDGSWRVGVAAEMRVSGKAARWWGMRHEEWGEQVPPGDGTRKGQSNGYFWAAKSVRRGVERSP